jgi:hypothetical protein
MGIYKEAGTRPESKKETQKEEKAIKIIKPTKR